MLANQAAGSWDYVSGYYWRFAPVSRKTEGAGHAAAGRLDGLNRGARLAEQGDLAGRAAEDGFVVAMAVNEDVCALQSVVKLPPVPMPTAVAQP